MPREIIQYSSEYVILDGQVLTQPHIPAPIADDEIRRTEEISAHWSKGEMGSAQLAVEYDAEQLRRLLESYDKGEWMGEVEPGRIKIWSGSLNRADLQRFIRLGRQMRNDVFGGDE